MKKFTFRYWGFGILEYKAAEEYLNNMGQQGWRLHRLCQDEWASFKRMEDSRRPGYCIGIYDSYDAAEVQRYITMCEDSGWVYKCASREKYHIFETLDAEPPVPLETDAESEWASLRELASVWSVIGAYIFYLAMMVPMTILAWKNSWSASLSDGAGILYLGIAYLTFYCCWMLVRNTVFLQRCKRLVKDEGRLPHIPLRQANRKRTLNQIAIAGILLAAYAWNIVVGMKYFFDMPGLYWYAKFIPVFSLLSIPVWALGIIKSLQAPKETVGIWNIVRLAGMFFLIVTVASFVNFSEL